jgi:hypothetical protein
MTVDCKNLRDDWQAGAQNKRKELLVHLDSCDACTDYTRRVEVARQHFQEHHGNLEPDAGFVSRVATRLPQDQNDGMGWAVARLFPATLVLVLILAWFSLSTTPVATDVVELQAPTDDLLSWVTDLPATEIEEDQ